MARGVLAAAMAREHDAIDAVFDEFAVPPPGVPAADWVPTLTAGLRALRRHIYLEEEIVFPLLQHGALQMPIMVMLTEHGEMWRRMADLERLLARDDVDAEPTRSQVAADCDALIELLVSHNRKEEPVIYPHLDADLDAPARELVEQYLAAGTLPGGWTPGRAAG